MEWWEYDVQLYSQIFFSLHSLHGLEDNIHEWNNIGIFYYAQNLLNSLANIAKLIKNDSSENAKKRCGKYREYLKIDFKYIPTVLNKSVRNTNEHIDERMDKANQLFKGFCDMSTGKYDNKSQNSLRYVNVEKRQIEFIDFNFEKVCLSLDEIKEELIYLKSLEPIDYVFERYDGYDKIL